MHMTVNSGGSDYRSRMKSQQSLWSTGPVRHTNKPEQAHDPAHRDCPAVASDALLLKPYFKGPKFPV